MITPNGGSQSLSWRQTYTFDRYGNRRFDTANTTTIPAGCLEPVCNPQIDPATNKLIGYQFDNAGNTKVDANGQIFIYDGENKQTEVRTATNAVVGQYFYNGDGQRIKKIVPSTGETTVFVYDASNKLVAEYSTIVEPQSTAEISYLTNDYLGSPRITTDAVGQVISRRDFLPFGEEINASTSGRTTAQGYGGQDSIRQKFTGYERDAETDLDFAQARYYAMALGRFTSPDPALESIRAENPQTLNRYSYCLNNPLAFVDPDGLEPLLVGNWNELSDEQRRLFQTYVETNYADALKAGTVTAESLWNQSAAVANEPGLLDEATPAVTLLTQAQLTTFAATTHMLEKRGVIGEVTSVTTINGDTPKDEFRIYGELKNAASIKKIEKAFDNGGFFGKILNAFTPDHGDYSISRREQGPKGEPSGQVSRIPNTTKIDTDVDYRAYIRSDHRTRENSDIRADDPAKKTSHYRRHVERYGPIPVLKPVNP